MKRIVIKPIEFKCFFSIRTYTTRNVRVRFAPSPTGYLHLGGLRTALYNFLFANKHNGKFILRIEDTDQVRQVSGATEEIIKDLLWAGINIDEGPSLGGSFGPYIQSQRLNTYREQVKVLLDNGNAYHCFCTEKRLQLLRKEALRMHEIPKYDNRCRYLPPDVVETRLQKGESSCIRFKMSYKEESFEDLVYGRISYNLSLNEGDPVIVKSDGFPTYHFANVVDDHFMEISHVLRGMEWQISTTKHILLYQAFNWKPPQFGHLPLLLNADGSKLSKRQGDIKISYYREKHVFPLALLNFIVHSGGGFTKDLQRNVKPKCYLINELSTQFNISDVNSHSGKLMPDRLSEFNRMVLKEKLQNNETKELIKQVKELIQVSFPKRIQDQSLQLNEDYIRNILMWSQDRITNLSDLVSKDMEFIWIIPTERNIDNLQLNELVKFKSKFETITELKTENLNKFFKTFCKDNEIKFGEFMKMLRYILSGLKVGPSVAEMIVILGKKNTMQRLEMSLKKGKHLR